MEVTIVISKKSSHLTEHDKFYTIRAKFNPILQVVLFPFERDMTNSTQYKIQPHFASSSFSILQRHGKFNTIGAKFNRILQAVLSPFDIDMENYGMTNKLKKRKNN